ncbi:M48 family metallopeptidase [Neptuniibacter halophilus]|uniref:M48 family metallopeptidase n=1 Tax=Neptuniibacter halophilus TaxID=651666 RepID=UPI00257308EA|nr:SprT family zinc-dependent metalloprotease [Neptuniibacter halophilus]
MDFDYTIVRSRRRKTAAIHVGSEGVVVRVPVWVTDQWVASFVASRSDWISKHEQAVRENLQAHAITLKPGAMLPYMGDSFRLSWEKGRARAVSRVADKIHVTIGGRSRKPELEQVEACLKSWYRDQARTQLQQRVEYWQQVMGLRPKSLTVKSFRRRWGSCSAGGDIQLNWRLIFASQALQDYVVIHELAHLVHLNHSPDFWQLVGEYCTEWKTKRKELQNRTGWVLW